MAATNAYMGGAAVNSNHDIEINIFEYINREKCTDEKMSMVFDAGAYLNDPGSCCGFCGCQGR